MKFPVTIGALLLSTVVASSASAQLAASHAATPVKAAVLPKAQMTPALHATGKPVARVNGTVLTDRDLLNEMFSIFPYARVHNGFPKSMEADIRKGAMDMIIFEELVYQEAERRHIQVPPERLNRALAEYRKRFPSEAEFNRFLRTGYKGSRVLLRQKVRRLLLIEAFLKTEVSDKSKISDAEAEAYYEKNITKFDYPETFEIQSISILPPDNPNPDVQNEARRRAEKALKQAKATKSYQEFGLLAEKVSEDDFHVNMGKHKPMTRDQFPPELLKVVLTMKPGDVSDLVKLGNDYTIVRLDRHTLAGRAKFADVEKSLKANLQKQKYDQLRSELSRRLHKNAKVEVL